MKVAILLCVLPFVVAFVSPPLEDIPDSSNVRHMPRVLTQAGGKSEDTDKFLLEIENRSLKKALEVQRNATIEAEIKLHFLEEDKAKLEKGICIIQAGTILEQFANTYGIAYDDLENGGAEWWKAFDTFKDEEPIKFILERARVFRLSKITLLQIMKRVCTYRNQQIHNKILNRGLKNFALNLVVKAPEPVVWFSNMIVEAYDLLSKKKENVPNYAKLMRQRGTAAN